MSDPIARAVTETLARAGRLRMRRGTWSSGNQVNVAGGMVTVDVWVSKPATAGAAVLILTEAGSNVGFAITA